MPTARIAKTFEKLRAGKLLGPTPDMKYMVTGGRGHTCRGCGELIGPLENAYYVRALRGADFSLHLVCAEAWLRFRQQQHGVA